MSLRLLLDKYLHAASSERAKGPHFDHFMKAWLENAPTRQPSFSCVLTFAEWAKENRAGQRDTGIDLVAQALRKRDRGRFGLSLSTLLPDHHR